MNHRHVFRVLPIAALTLLPWTAQAATYSVTRTDDPAPDGCLANDCSLREAVIAANVATSADLILLPATDHGLTRVGVGGAEIGDLDIEGTLTIRGDGATPSTIQASHLMRILDVHPFSTLHLDNLKLLNGQPDAAEFSEGGCLNASDSSVTIRRTVFDGCIADGGSGGAISAANTNLSLTDSSIANSQAAAFGGAVKLYVNGGVGPRQFIATNVLVFNNEAGQGGGALYLSGATLTTSLRGVLISSNEAGFFGGGIQVTNGGSGGEQLFLDLVTLADNHAGQGGGMHVADASVEARRTRLIDNIADYHSGGARVDSADGSLLFEQSTAYGNSAAQTGGAFKVSFGELVVRNSTIGDNTAASGSALYADSGASVRFVHATIVDLEPSIVRINHTDTTVSWSNSIIKADFYDACSIFSGSPQFTSLGGNLEGADSCGLDHASDLIHLMPYQFGLGSFDHHGGATENYSLDPVSLALDHALPGTCAHLDQRLAVREAAHCDAGSHEAEGVANDHLFADGFEP